MGEVVVNSKEVMELEVEVEKRQQSNKEEQEEEEDGGSKENLRSESCLPKMVLRVLLVEADDSTRQIVSALLRKCGYRVSAVADGLKAWETVRERARNIDLILTEVELPLISGFALLSLVMEHDVCKNIPVIMMSSQDSISMVFKCMLKGAVDFLIKPLRRNELRNLWQHVWRRHTLFSGQFAQNSTAPDRKVKTVSENNAASNYSSDNVISVQNTKAGSEKGSEAQSSCTTPFLEAVGEHVQTMQDISHLESVTAFNLSKNHVERHEGCDKPNKELVVHLSKTGGKSNIFKPEVVSCNGAFRSTVLRLKEDHICHQRMKQDEFFEPGSFKDNANVTTDIQSCCDELVNPSSGAIDLIGTFDDHPRCTSGSSVVKVNGSNYSEYAPQLELSLMRMCSKGSNSQGTGERPKLNHSSASAFSWYNNSNTLQPLFPTCPSSPTKSEERPNKSEELLFNQFSRKSTDGSQQHAATRSNCQDNMPDLAVGQSGHTEVSFPSPQLGLIPATGLKFENVCSGYGQFFPSLFYPQSSPTWSPISASQQEKSSFVVNTSTHSDPEIDNSERGCHHSEETTNKSTDQTKQEQTNLELVEELKPSSLAADQGAGGSFCNVAADHINSGANGSTSLCGRSDGSATSAAADEETTAFQGLKDNTDFVHERFRGMDSFRTSQREAALTKFRMKRKDRCFEKKVRYQSRKRLAEQRPRVKGQFVRQLPEVS